MGFENDISDLAKERLPQTAKLDRGTAMALIERLAQQEFPPSEAEARPGAEPRLWKKYGNSLLKSGILDGFKDESAMISILKSKKVGTLACLGAMFEKVLKTKDHALQRHRRSQTFKISKRSKSICSQNDCIR